MENTAQLERKCIDKINHFKAEKYDREKQQPSIQHLFELDSELKQLVSENQTLKCRLSQLRLQTTRAEAVPDNTDITVVSELQKHLNQTTELLNKAKEELSETRQQLLNVQERLTVAEQVTAATQQRALQQSGNSDDLQLELTPQHQSTTHTGTVLIS